MSRNTGRELRRSREQFIDSLNAMPPNPVRLYSYPYWSTSRVQAYFRNNPGVSRGIYGGGPIEDILGLYDDQALSEALYRTCGVVPVDLKGLVTSDTAVSRERVARVYDEAVGQLPLIEQTVELALFHSPLHGEVERGTRKVIVPWNEWAPQTSLALAAYGWAVQFMAERAASDAGRLNAFMLFHEAHRFPNVGHTLDGFWQMQGGEPLSNKLEPYRSIAFDHVEIADGEDLGSWRGGDVVFYNAGGVREDAKARDGFGPFPRYKPPADPGIDRPGELWSVSVDRPTEPHQRRETMRRTLAHVKGRGAGYTVKGLLPGLTGCVVPWVSVGSGWNRGPGPRKWELGSEPYYHDFSQWFSYMLGGEMCNPWYSRDAEVEEFFDNRRVRAVGLWPALGDPRTPFWSDHFIAFVAGATGTPYKGELA